MAKEQNPFIQENILLSEIDGNDGQIKGIPENPRIITDEKFQELKAKLKKDQHFRFNKRPVVYPFKGRYIALTGNQRLAAWKELGLWDAIPVDVIKKEFLKKKELILDWVLSDNVSSGEWDRLKLSKDWEDVTLINAGLEPLGTGFEPINMPSFAEDEIEQEDIEAAASEQAKSMLDEKGSLTPVVCPHCGHEFKVST